MIHPMSKCRDISRLASRAMDERLSLWQRFSIRMHLIICLYCRRFFRQLKMLRRVASLVEDDDPSVVLSREARLRIQAALKLHQK